MHQLPSQHEQMQALLTGRAFELVRSLFGGRPLSGNEYADVFTVSREEVLAYVQRYGFPKGSYSDSVRSVDGPYMIEEDGTLLVYYQERGVPVGAVRFTDRALAHAALLDLLLGLSGTGLYGRG